MKLNYKNIPLATAYWFQEGPGVRNWQFKGSGIKLLNVGNILKSGEIDLTNTDRYLDPAEVSEKYRHFLVDEGDLVIASSGISIDDDQLLRTRGAFIEKHHLPLCLNTSTIRFKAKKKISSIRFLKYWLNSREFRVQITREVTGIAQKNFGPSHLKRLKISLPPLEAQEHIADILDKADSIRRKRRQAIELADKFLRSVFLDMFGDPITNPKKWEKGRLRDLCEEIVDCPHATPKYAAEQTEFACIRSSDIQNGYMDWSTTKYVEEAEYRERIKRLEPLPNDVIYCREGARFGNAARIPEGRNICLGQRMMLFRSNNTLATAEFIWALLNSNSIYHQAVQKIGGSASPHINVADIKKFSVFVPPLSIQEKYSKAVMKLEVMKQKYQSFLLKSDQIFNSITQRAFRGEL